MNGDEICSEVSFQGSFCWQLLFFFPSFSLSLKNLNIFGDFCVIFCAGAALTIAMIRTYAKLATIA